MSGNLSSLVGAGVYGGVYGLFSGVSSVISSIGNYFIARRAITVIEPHLARVGRRGERLVRDGVVGGNRLVRDTGAGVERVARDVARSGERLVRDGANGGTNLVRSTGAGVERVARDVARSGERLVRDGAAGGTSLVRDMGRGAMEVATGIGGTFKEWGDNTGSFGKKTVNKTFYTAQRWGDNIGRTVTGGFLASGIIYLADKAIDVFFKHHQIAATACKENPESSYCLADRITAHLSIAGPFSAILVLGVAIYLAPRVIWREPVIKQVESRIQPKYQYDGSSDISSESDFDEEPEMPSPRSRSENKFQEVQNVDVASSSYGFDEEPETPPEVTRASRRRLENKSLKYKNISVVSRGSDNKQSQKRQSVTQENIRRARETLNELKDELD